VPESIGPVSPKPSGEVPLYSAFSMLHIVFVFSFEVLNSFLPKELPPSIHLPFNPISIVAFAVEPSIPAVPLELVINKFSFILLRKFASSNVFIQEVRIVQESQSFDVLQRTFPSQFCYGLLKWFLKLFIFEFDELLYAVNYVRGIPISIVFHEPVVFLFYLLLEFVVDEKGQSALAFLEVVVELTIIDRVFVCFNSFSIFSAFTELSLIIIGVCLIFDRDFSFPIELTLGKSATLLHRA
jgi:hypothetical protein